MGGRRVQAGATAGHADHLRIGGHHHPNATPEAKNQANLELVEKARHATDRRDGEEEAEKLCRRAGQRRGLPSREPPP